MRTRRLRRLLTVLAPLALAPLAGVPAAAHAATVTVCPSGCAYAQIQPAINAASSGDTINIGAGVYYGAIDITKNVTLVGAGAGSTSIQGIHLGYPNNTNDRAIVIDIGATVRIQGVTITGDGASGSPTDGGILNFGTLTVTNSAISNNRGDFGGGIANESTLTVTNSAISGNFATQTGGGITNYAGSTATVSNSTISGNDNLGEGLGGGIANEGTLTVSNSAISGNSAYKIGGGIANDSGGTATVTNSTISGNSANDYEYQPGTSGSVEDTYGGGIFNQGSTLTITNSTISNNGANATGGGIENDQGTVTLSNSILAKNTAPSAFPDCRGALTDGSGGHNLVGDGSYCSGLTNGVNGDQVGTSTNPIDPKLGPLQDNGGPTQTMALQYGSLAISAGDATTCEDLVGPNGAHDADQRGQPRNSASRGTCDVGAFDTAQIPVCPSGCAYAQIQPAIDAAYSGDTISIAAGAYSGGLSISKNLTLAGTGAGSVTIQGGDSVVYINSGATVRIQGVTITGGNATYYGGGIQNHGALTLDRSTVSGNTTDAGISYSGGGGIANVGALIVTNSTISGNSAQFGGGIYNGSGDTVTLANSTISGNSAFHDGGLYNEGAVTLSGTILARNTASLAPDCGGALTDGPGGHNLLGDNSYCSGLTNGVDGDQVGTDATPIDPKLGPVQNNGGPTQTQALLPGSPAIDAIPTSTGLCPATDQRGVSRPDDNESLCDIGAYESNYTLLATSVSAVSGAGTYGGTATLTATLTAGGALVGGKTITVTLNGTAVCGGSGQSACPTTDNNGVATLQTVSLAGINAGSYATAVGASFAGDTGYSASTATGALTIGKATQTITFGPLANHTYGDSPFQVNATTSSGLAVSFSASGACTVSGNTVTITGAGSCAITAAQGGDSNDNPAPSVSQTFSIAQASATISLDQGSLGATYDGNPHRATATTNPSGLSYSVSYTDASNTPVTNPTNAGAYSVTASVTDPNYSGRATGALVIAKANQSIAVTTPAPSSAAYNATFTVAATASSGLSVVYGSSGSCSNTGATVTMTSGRGACTVTVDQAGNGNYNAAQEVTDTVTAQKANQTITFDPLASHTYGDRPFTISATTSSGLAVSFSIGGADQCAISGNTVTITGAGSCTVTAAQPGDSNYNAAPTVSQTFAIAKAGTTTTLTSSANPSVAGRPVTYTATIAVTSLGASSPGGTVAFTDNGSVITGCGTVGVGATGVAICPVSYATAGSHPITAVYSGDSNDAGSAANTVNQTVSSDLTTSLTLSPNPVARGATFTISGSATNIGTASESVTLSYTTTAPNGTTTSSSLGTVTVGPGKTVSRTTTYTVPRKAPTGAYTVTLTAQDKTGRGSATAQETVS